MFSASYSDRPSLERSSFRVLLSSALLTSLTLALSPATSFAAEGTQIPVSAQVEAFWHAADDAAGAHPIPFAHQRGHEGSPRNELAEEVAKVVEVEAPPKKKVVRKKKVATTEA